MPLSARISSAIENAREAIADHIRGSVGGAEGEIAAALIVGVRAGIPEEINEAMRRTGIYHIISISGLHMALVAGTIMVLMRGAFALFPDFSSRRPVKKYAAAAALFSIAAYLVISGVVVAAERSFIMLAVMLIAVLFDRAALTMRNLAISAIAVIVVSPHEVVGPSFQMSFAATAALVGAYAGWSDYRAGKATAAATAIAAGFLVAKIPAGDGWPRHDLHHRRQRHGAVCHLAFSARVAAQPVCQSGRHADRLADRHAFRRAQRAGDAVRRRWAVPLCDGQGSDGDDRHIGMDFGALADRCGRADFAAVGPAGDGRAGHRHDGDDMAAAGGTSVRACRPVDARQVHAGQDEQRPARASLRRL